MNDESIHQFLRDAAEPDLDEKALESALDEAARDEKPFDDEKVSRMLREAQSGPLSPLSGSERPSARTAQRTVRTTL